MNNHHQEIRRKISLPTLTSSETFINTEGRPAPPVPALPNEYYCSTRIRPLPHLPATPTNSSNNPATTFPIPELPQQQQHHLNRASGFSGGVSYTNILHDYDQPLGAHSIPTRISTRPICFSSSAAEPPTFSDQHHHPINTSDERDHSISPSKKVIYEEDQVNEDEDEDDDSIPLQIYTTRPSIEQDAYRHRRSTSINQILFPSPHHHQNLSSSPHVRAPRHAKRSDTLGGNTASKLSNIKLQPGFNIAYLSHVAQFLLDHVARDTKIKANVEYPLAFTGRDAVTIITHCLNRVNPSTRSTTQATLNRKLALRLTRTLFKEKFFHEVNSSIDDDHHPDFENSLNDNIEEVYIFPSNQYPSETDNNWMKQSSSSSSTSSSSTSSSSNPNDEYNLIESYRTASTSSSSAVIQLPQSVLTPLTKCYSFACQMSNLTSLCYSYDCPSKKNRSSVLINPPTLLSSTISSSTPSDPIPVASSSVVQTTKDWASIVPKELLLSLDSKEIARQSIIYELISGEQEYVQDLDDYEKLFIIPLVSSTPSIIAPSRIGEFKEKVVSNVLEIRDHNRVLLQNLLIRQQDQHPLVQSIGDVLLNSALEWGQDYIRYTSDHVFGEVEVNEEKSKNLQFAELINKIPKVSPRRADFKHYYSRAFVRLQRYNLLLESLLKKTPDDHADRSSIEDAIEVIRRQCKDADLAVSIQQAKLTIVKLNNEIVLKADTPDLQLLSPNRQLIFAGKMLRKPEGGAAGLSEWSEQHVILFDNYFIMSKVKRIDENNQRYHLTRPPVMLELMRVTGFNDPCERRARGLRTITGTLANNLERGNSDPYTSNSSPSNGPSAGGSLGAGGSGGGGSGSGGAVGLGASSSVGGSGSTGPGGGGSGGAGGGGGVDWVFPITIQSLGRNNYSSTMYVESERIRNLWKSKFEEAIGLRLQILDSFKVFDLYPMTDQTFAASGSSTVPPTTHNNTPISASHVNGSGVGGSSGSLNSSASSSAAHLNSNNSSNRPNTVGEAISNMHGPPTCSVPFRSTDGKRLIAIGCQDGLWIGLRHDPGSMKQVIYLKSITQCSVLQEFGFLLVLAEKILMAYPLDSLIPSRNSPHVHHQQHPSTHSTPNSIGMGIGTSTGLSRTPVRAIASRLSGNKDVLFFRCGKVGPRTLVIYVKKGGVNQTVFKALEPVRNSEQNQVSNRRGFFGLGGHRSESFRGYKEFFVPSESYAIQYLRNTLTIHCARGFEIMNIDTLKTASIPDFNQIKQQDARLVALQRRCDESRPLGMFRLGDNEFLLCYDEFAFFADKHGDPLVDRYNSMMEWDGRPTTVAYSPPYVICFSSTLVEVWNTLTSKRVQIILGQSIVCTYDGGALGDDGTHSSRTINIDNPGSKSAGSVMNSGNDDDEGERRVHVMIKDLDSFYRVFEMVPLSPL
ncbi:hypothetical protein MJO28_011399 [Puccinia striiformis f. sp. tritici]|uniref:Uncharacterized protein n=1 Tax=Puccinia striiformis f. sp. tritici TaxID=168172 RepID=A0ACC0E2L7_9BASI|nr:hypothetical protein MJO28_011399 [Puccinia striiformis f. sp. tritici]